MAALAAVVFLTSCSTKKVTDPYAVPGAKPSTRAQPREKPIVTPVTGLQGRISSLNAAYRFVVVTFPFAPLPEVGRTLSVYRAGLKVGEIRVTPPAPVGLNVAADIVAGEARVGDEVFEH